MEIIIGTRNSPLAIAQAEIIKRAIARKYDFAIQIITFKTQGDRNLQAFGNFANVKGLFTLELEKALLNHEIDLAVHSLKDMSANQNPALEILAYSKREDPRDALILKHEHEKILTIGSSSLRRKLQLRKIFPHSQLVNLRGNIHTRIRKLHEQDLSGIVLAAAGLKRMNLEHIIARFFTIDEIMPAPGQGILACQGRRGENYFYMDAVNDPESEACAIAERSFSEFLGAGCNVPVGANAAIHDGKIFLAGLYIDEKSGISYRENISGEISQAKSLGKILAEQVIAKCRM